MGLERSLLLQASLESAQVAAVGRRIGRHGLEVGVQADRRVAQARRPPAGVGQKRVEGRVEVVGAVVRAGDLEGLRRRKRLDAAQQGEQDE